VDGATLVIDVGISVNLVSLTIEQVIGKMKSSLLDLINISIDRTKGLAHARSEEGSLRRTYALSLRQGADWFNIPTNYSDAVSKVIATQLDAGLEACRSGATVIATLATGEALGYARHAAKKRDVDLTLKLMNQARRSATPAMAAVTGDVVNTKFVDDYEGREMIFGTQTDFFSGLGGLIGPPNLNLLEGMRLEHFTSKDSHEKFTTTDTQKITTTSYAEFFFVTDPEMLTSQLGSGDDAVKKQKTAENQKRLKGQRKPQLPSDMSNARDSAPVVREPKMPVEFQAKLAAKNEQLVEIGIAALTQEEFYAARLLTGPMVRPPPPSPRMQTPLLCLLVQD